jgi:hypothetical protein
MAELSSSVKAYIDARKDLRLAQEREMARLQEQERFNAEQTRLRESQEANLQEQRLQREQNAKEFAQTFGFQKERAADEDQWKILTGVQQGLINTQPQGKVGTVQPMPEMPGIPTMSPTMQGILQQALPNEPAPPGGLALGGQIITPITPQERALNETRAGIEARNLLAQENLKILDENKDLLPESMRNKVGVALRLGLTPKLDPDDIQTSLAREIELAEDPDLTTEERKRHQKVAQALERTLTTVRSASSAGALNYGFNQRALSKVDDVIKAIDAQVRQRLGLAPDAPLTAEHKNVIAQSARDWIALNNGTPEDIAAVQKSLEEFYGSGKDTTIDYEKELQQRFGKIILDNLDASIERSKQGARAPKK